MKKIISIIASFLILGTLTNTCSAATYSNFDEMYNSIVWVKNTINNEIKKVNTPMVKKVLVSSDKRLLANTFNVSNNEEWVVYTLNTANNKDIFTNKQYLKNQKDWKVYFLWDVTQNNKKPSFSPNSQYLVLNNGIDIKIINLVSLNTIKIKNNYKDWESYGDVAFVNDKIFVSGWFNKIHLFNIEGKTKTINAEWAQYNISFSNGKIVSGEYEVNVNGKNIIDNRWVQANAMLLNNSKYLITNQRASFDGMIATKIYNFETKELKTLGVNFSNGVITQDNKVYYIRNNGWISMFDINTGVDTDIITDKWLSNNEYGLRLVWTSLYFTSADGKSVSKISIK